MKPRSIEPRVIGTHPLAKDANGQPLSRIGTIFPYSNTLVTLPGIHATQRLAYLDAVDEERLRKGASPMSDQERSVEWSNAVDLIMERDTILIRPDPDNMALAFKADEILTQYTSTRQVRFLHVRHEKVHEAIKHRGECWRTSPLPKSTEEMMRMICSSRIGIGGRQIYYYNNTTGTRFLTCHEFSRLVDWPEDERRQILHEIQQHSVRVNRLGNPEIAFFLADKSFSKQDFAGHDFLGASTAQLASSYAALRDKFYCSVPMGYRQDDVTFVDWRNRMFAKLIAERDEMVAEETMLGLSSEFFLHVEWLPGGRFEHGEFVLDPIFGYRTAGQPCDPLCDDKVLGFIFSFIREYGDLEYVNVGRVVESLSRGRVHRGRRDVFLAELKPCDSKQEIVKVIRLQKYGVAERLNEGKELLQSMLETEQYTDYVLDRRLACRQLGMNILPRLTTGKLEETYGGKNEKWRGRTIWSPYFERDYIRGAATDKVPNHRFKDETFAELFARLLGRAAAPNLIVGRQELDGLVVFDDGDEVIVEDEQGLPTNIVVVDQLGTFTDYTSPLVSFAADYAKPIRKRLPLVSRPADFAAAYLQAFNQRFSKIQQDYRRRQRAFDNLFAHRASNEPGSFAYRWTEILKRLDETDPDALTEAIRRHIHAS